MIIPVHFVANSARSPLPQIVSILGLSVGYSTYSNATHILGDYDIEREAKAKEKKTWAYGGMGVHAHSARGWSRGSLDIGVDCEYFTSSNDGIIDLLQVENWKGKLGQCWGKRGGWQSPLDELEPGTSLNRVEKRFQSYTKGWNIKLKRRKDGYSSLDYKSSKKIDMGKLRTTYTFEIWLGWYKNEMYEVSLMVDADPPLNSYDEVHQGR